MKTDDYIKILASELKPRREPGFYKTVLASWSLGNFAIFGLAFTFLPMRVDLAERLQSVLFTVETVLSFVAFVAAAYVAYRSSVPGLLQARERRIAIAIMIGIGALLISKISTEGLAAEFAGEMDFYRGRCGPIMLILGVLEIALGMGLARLAAPTSPAKTGAWIALSGGAVGLFVVQFICAHENFLHLVIWHAVPLGLLAGGGTFLGRRLLRW